MGVSDAALAMDEALKDNLGMTERGDLLLKYQGGGVGGGNIDFPGNYYTPPPLLHILLHLLVGVGGY